MNRHPLSTCHFQVEWGGTRLGVTQIIGLGIEIEPIEFRDGNSNDNSPEVMPGQEKPNTIILRRGIIKGDNEYFNWFNTIRLNTVERRDLTISLLNENHEPVVVWKLRNAFPIKLYWSTLNADANEPAMESLEVIHGGMVVQND